MKIKGAGLLSLIGLGAGTLTLILAAGVSLAAITDKDSFRGSSSLKEKITNSSVSIFSVSPGFSSCTGILISENEYAQYVLTAKHCITTSEEVYVEHVKADLYVASTIDDLAIIIISEKLDNKVPVEMAKSSIDIEEQVHHIGFPSGYPDIKSFSASGIVSRKSTDWGIARMKSINGCSGGGIFNDNGELVGVLWGGYRVQNTDITLFEPLEDINNFLTDINRLDH